MDMLGNSRSVSVFLATPLYDQNSTDPQLMSSAIKQTMLEMIALFSMGCSNIVPSPREDPWVSLPLVKKLCDVSSLPSTCVV